METLQAQLFQDSGEKLVYFIVVREPRNVVKNVVRMVPMPRQGSSRRRLLCITVKSRGITQASGTVGSVSTVRVRIHKVKPSSEKLTDGKSGGKYVIKETWDLQQLRSLQQSKDASTKFSMIFGGDSSRGRPITFNADSVQERQRLFWKLFTLSRKALNSTPDLRGTGPAELTLLAEANGWHLEPTGLEVQEQQQEVIMSDVSAAMHDTQKKDDEISQIAEAVAKKPQSEGLSEDDEAALLHLLSQHNLGPENADQLTGLLVQDIAKEEQEQVQWVLESEDPVQNLLMGIDRTLVNLAETEHTLHSLTTNLHATFRSSGLESLLADAERLTTLMSNRHALQTEIDETLHSVQVPSDVLELLGCLSNTAAPDLSDRRAVVAVVKGLRQLNSAIDGAQGEKLPADHWRYKVRAVSGRLQSLATHRQKAISNLLSGCADSFTQASTSFGVQDTADAAKLHQSLYRSLDHLTPLCSYMKDYDLAIHSTIRRSFCEAMRSAFRKDARRILQISPTASIDSFATAISQLCTLIYQDQKFCLRLFGLEDDFEAAPASVMETVETMLRALYGQEVEDSLSALLAKFPQQPSHTSSNSRDFTSAASAASLPGSSGHHHHHHSSTIGSLASSLGNAMHLTGESSASAKEAAGKYGEHFWPAIWVDVRRLRDIVYGPRSATVLVMDSVLLRIATHAETCMAKTSSRLLQEMQTASKELLRLLGKLRKRSRESSASGSSSSDTNSATTGASAVENATGGANGSGDTADHSGRIQTLYTSALHTISYAMEVYRTFNRRRSEAIDSLTSAMAAAEKEESRSTTKSANTTAKERESESETYVFSHVQRLAKGLVDHMQHAVSLSECITGAVGSGHMGLGVDGRTAKKREKSSSHAGESEAQTAVTILVDSVPTIVQTARLCRIFTTAIRSKPLPSLFDSQHVETLLHDLSHSAFNGFLDPFVCALWSSARCSPKQLTALYCARAQLQRSNDSAAANAVSISGVVIEASHLSYWEKVTDAVWTALEKAFKSEGDDSLPYVWSAAVQRILPGAYRSLRSDIEKHVGSGGVTIHPSINEFEAILKRKYDAVAQRLLVRESICKKTQEQLFKVG